MTKRDCDLTMKEENDGRQDCHFNINGVKTFTLHQEGWMALGMSVEQAKEALVNLSQIMLTIMSHSVAQAKQESECAKS
jgi:hypothetical protein